jgi:SAM-dependent methyltransferase
MKNQTNIQDNNNKATWANALGTEESFWDLWFEKRGFEWPDDFQTRIDPAAQLAAWVKEHFVDYDSGSDCIRILDVGAGPLTVLGYIWKERAFRIYAVDPLADIYDQLLKKHQIVPPLRTTWCQGELLTERFPENSFDLVHAQNSLDHSFNPVAVIENCIRLVKPGCMVLLRHHTNEAVTGRYEGLHQWNFCSEDGDFIVWNEQVKFNLSRMLESSCSISCEDDGSIILVRIVKNA